MRFRKIEEGQVDLTRVTLMPMRGEDGTIIGRVTTLALDERGETSLMTTADADPPLDQAIELAVQLAEFKEQEVDVLDPHDLWPEDIEPIG